MKNQIAIVYPLIKHKAKSLSCFKDYSASLKTDNYVSKDANTAFGLGDSSVLDTKTKKGFFS